MRLDSHQHFWRYDPVEYSWITDKLAPLRRDFLPPDLKTHLDASKLDGCIAVQARQTVGETRWLLELAAQYSIVRGVVGWVDLRSGNVDKDLAELTKNPRLVG